MKNMNSSAKSISTAIAIRGLFITENRTNIFSTFTSLRMNLIACDSSLEDSHFLYKSVDSINRDRKKFLYLY